MNYQLTFAAKTKFSRVCATILLSFLSFSGCAWVKVTPQGESVRVVATGEASNCVKVGETTATVLAKIIFVKRDAEKIETELKTMAKNAASEMGGDTIFANAEVENGKQTFSIYKCVP